MDPRVPQPDGQVVIASDLLGQLVQLRDPDAQSGVGVDAITTHALGVGGVGHSPEGTHNLLQSL